MVVRIFHVSSCMGCLSAMLGFDDANMLIVLLHRQVPRLLCRRRLLRWSAAPLHEGGSRGARRIVLCPLLHGLAELHG